MSPRERLSAPERRAAILKAVLPLFAKKGLAGTTSREIARAAGVSEALVFRHFGSKEELYSALAEAWLERRESHPGLGRLLSLPPGAKKLVHTVAYLVRHMADPDPGHLPRLIARSLVDDGAFARTVLDRFSKEWIPVFTESIREAARAGDLRSTPDGARLGIWFSHHLGLALSLTALPPEAAAGYGRDRETVIREAVRFSLRGLGLPAEIVDRELEPA